MTQNASSIRRGGDAHVDIAFRTEVAGGGASDDGRASKCGLQRLTQRGQVVVGGTEEDDPGTVDRPELGE